MVTRGRKMTEEVLENDTKEKDGKWSEGHRSLKEAFLESFHFSSNNSKADFSAVFASWNGDALSV